MITLDSQSNYYRITPSFFGPNKQQMTSRDAFTGDGSLLSRDYGRYHPPQTRTIYLGDTPEICLSEQLFYLHKKTIDILHKVPITLPQMNQYLLWEVQFHNPINKVFDLNENSAPSEGVFPSLITNPYQHYTHTSSFRTRIESKFNGIRVRSARALPSKGHSIILFHDQSTNLRKVIVYGVELRLIQLNGHPFQDHLTDTLTHCVGEVKIIPVNPPALPHSLIRYQTWRSFTFIH